MSEIFFKLLSIVGITVAVVFLGVLSLVSELIPLVFVILGLSLLREGNYLESQTVFLASLAWFFIGKNVMNIGLLAKLRELVGKK